MAEMAGRLKNEEMKVLLSEDRLKRCEEDSRVVREFKDRLSDDNMRLGESCRVADS